MPQPMWEGDIGNMVQILVHWPPVVCCSQSKSWREASVLYYHLRQGATRVLQRVKAAPLLPRSMRTTHTRDDMYGLDMG
jgi:hypothetical protein